MSGEAHTWACAVPCPSPRAKAVLRSLGSYADVDGRSWVAMSVLLVETELGTERTVQRGLADLKKAGLIVPTGETKLFVGRLYPIYQLSLDQGPANTRQRLAQEGGRLGVTPVSPQERATGDTSVTPRGDSCVALGVTPVSPKKIPEIYQLNTEGAREVGLAEFEQLEAAYHPDGLKFTDRGLAWTAFQAEIAAGEDAAELIARAGRCRIDPCWKSMKAGPAALQTWLSNKRHRGWAIEAAGPGASAAAPGGFAGPTALRAEIARRFGEAFAVSYLDRAKVEDGRLTPASSRAAEKLAGPVMAEILGRHGLTLAERSTVLGEA